MYVPESLKMVQNCSWGILIPFFFGELTAPTLIFFVNREWALIFFVNREQYPLFMTLVKLRLRCLSVHRHVQIMTTLKNNGDGCLNLYEWTRHRSAAHLTAKF